MKIALQKSWVYVIRPVLHNTRRSRIIHGCSTPYAEVEGLAQMIKGSLEITQGDPTLYVQVFHHTRCPPTGSSGKVQCNSRHIIRSNLCIIQSSGDIIHRSGRIVGRTSKMRRRNADFSRADFILSWRTTDCHITYTTTFTIHAWCKT